MKLPMFVGTGVSALNGLLNNLVSYYKFDNDVLDAHGSNDGTLNGATYTASGKINGGYSYDGINDFISLPSGTSPSGGTARTISMWVKTVAEAVGSKTFYSTGTEVARQVLTINYDVLTNNDIYIAFNSNDFYTGTGVITDGTWHHIVLVYDGGTLSTSTVHLYIDDVLQSLTHSNINPGVAVTATTTTNIGNDKNSAGRETYATIDEIGIWNTNKTSTDVTALYNSTNGLPYSSFTT